MIYVLGSLIGGLLICLFCLYDLYKKVKFTSDFFLSIVQVLDKDMLYVAERANEATNDFELPSQAELRKLGFNLDHKGKVVLTNKK